MSYANEELFFLGSDSNNYTDPSSAPNIRDSDNKTALRKILMPKKGLRESGRFSAPPPPSRLKCIQVWTLNIYTVLWVSNDVGFRSVWESKHPRSCTDI